jgi:hypothetical protein
MILAQFQTEPIGLPKLLSSPSDHATQLPVSGDFEASGRLRATLEPPALELKGTASIRAIEVGQFSLGDTNLAYALAGDGFDFSGGELQALGGQAQLHGRWTFGTAHAAPVKTPDELPNGLDGGADRGEQLHLEGRFQDVQLAEFLSRLTTGLPSVSGQAQGQFQLDYRAIASGSGQRISFSGSATTSRIQGLGSAIEKLLFEFAGTDKDLRLPRWTALLPAGTISGSATLLPDTEGLVWNTFLSASGLDLEKLLRMQVPANAGYAVRGRVALDAVLRVDLGSCEVKGGGTARLSNLILDNLPALDSVTGRLEIPDNQQLVLRDFHAVGWGGSGRGTFTIDRQPGVKMPVKLVLERVDGIELAQPFDAWPALRGKARGRLSGRGWLAIPNASSAQPWSGAGEFDVSSGAFSGLPLKQARLTVLVGEEATAEISRARIGTVYPEALGGPAGENKILVRVATAQTANGTARGHCILRIGTPLRYYSQFRFDSLSLATLAQSVFGSPHQIAGTLSGDINLYGTDRGAHDARGDMRLNLRDARLWPFPVFAVIAKVLKLNLSESGAFDRGDGVAFLKDRTLTFQEFGLAGSAVQLFGEGTVGLDGRIKMEVVGNVDTPISRRVPLLDKFQQALGFLQQRLIKIHLSGTLDEPTAVPVPLHDLSEPALRFFKGVLSGVMFDTEAPRSRVRTPQ